MLGIQRHISRQTKAWLREHVARPWSNAAALDCLLDVGIACTAENHPDRLDLPTARQRLARTLDAYAREARECLCVAVTAATTSLRQLEVCAADPGSHAPIQVQVAGFTLLVAYACVVAGTAMTGRETHGSGHAATWPCACSVQRRWLLLDTLVWSAKPHLRLLMLRKPSQGKPPSCSRLCSDSSTGGLLLGCSTLHSPQNPLGATCVSPS